MSERKSILAMLEKMLETSREQIYGFNSEVAAIYHDGKEEMLEHIIDLIKEELDKPK